MASRARALVASFALLGAGGCVAEGGAPLTSDDGGGHVAVSVAALSLPGVHDAVWDLRVATGASAETTVVTKRLTASGYGDGVDRLRPLADECAGFYAELRAAG